MGTPILSQAQVDAQRQETRTVEQLSEKERDLERQLEALRKERFTKQQEENKKALDAAKLAKAQAPVKIIVEQIVGGNVLMIGDFRDDVVEQYQITDGRLYRGNKENLIPLAQLENLCKRLTALPNVTVEFREDVKDEIEWMLTAPTWLIEKGVRHLECKAGPRADASIYYKIPGAEWNAAKRLLKVPLPEGYNLFMRLDEVEGVVWSDEAAQFVQNQIEKRGKLDEIALLERGEKYFEYDMNGVKLRPFQEVGCEFIDATGGRALLADEMGLGKTIQALAYAIMNNLRTIVICPASLKANWAREIYRLSGKKATVLQGAEPTTHDMASMIVSPQQFTIINYDIAGRKAEIKTETKDQEGYTHERNDTRFFWVELINMSKPDLIIIDEGHYIKNVDSNRSQAIRQIKAPHVICMTGTPVLNRPGELWPMLYLLAPEQFPAYETFLTQYTKDGKTARNVEELRQIMKAIMIRRLKRDVVQDLPPINRIQEYHELSPKALKLYRKIEMGIYEAISEFSAKSQHGGEMSAASILAKIQRWKMVCAIDKVGRTAEQAMELYDQTDESEHRKVLIFSQYKASAWGIFRKLEAHGALSFVSNRKGTFHTANDNERDALVQQFQTDPAIKFLIVTEKTAKEGHNITAAGHVIFNDLFWTPAGHEQGEGRAYGRMNDSHSINSYYMITDMDSESIEEWIMELLDIKKQVINEVVEGVEASRDVSIANALIERMKEKMWSAGGKSQRRIA